MFPPVSGVVRALQPPAPMSVSTVATLVALALLAACGGDDGGGGSPDAPPASGLCAGRPCRTSIDDQADWAAVSAPLTGTRCELVEDTKYLAPATFGTALTEVVFQDVKVHRFHLEFMTQVLTEIFGGLSAQQYQTLVQRRGSRQYWAGAIYRIVDLQGETVAYGFDVIVDPTVWDEHVTEDEVLAIEALLETRFHLPLIYAPTEPEAVYRSYNFERVERHVPRACQYVACPDAGTHCVQVPQAVTMCGHFMEGRDIAVEHARKARLEARAGTYVLPRAAGTHTVPAIFGSGELGPTHAAITPASETAVYEVIDHGQFFSRRYRQPFTTGGRRFDLEWDVRLPEQRRWLPVHRAAHRPARVDDRRRSTAAPCTTTWSRSRRVRRSSSGGVSTAPSPAATRSPSTSASSRRRPARGRCSRCAAR